MTPGILGSDVTLDLNGHTLTSTASDNALLLSRSGSESSHKSFKIINSAEEQGNFISNCTGSNCSISVQGNYNDLVIGENVKFTGDIGIFKNGCTVDVYGEVEDKRTGVAIATNGSNTTNATINIHEGAVVKAESAAIYQPSSTSILNIEGGILTGATAVYAKAGQLNISGGTLQATGERKDYKYNGSGFNPTGDALVLESSSSGYKGNPVANITGGTLISDNADAIGVYKYENTHFEDPSLDVTDGSFSVNVDDFTNVGYRSQLDETTGLYTVKEDLTMYEVSFDANGGTGEMETLTGRFKEKVELPECKFKEPFEKKFTGWEIDGETYQPAYELTLSENLKVRAVWEDAKLRQTLTFDNEKIEKTFGDTEFRLEPNGAKTNIVYTSSDEKVLTVAEDGTVTIVGAGDAYIKATAQETEEYFSASAQYNVTVSKASFSISASVSDWGYGAEPNDVTVTGNITDEKPVIEYKAADADDNAYSTEIPQNAGKYKVRVTVPESANYKSAQAETEFSIQRVLPDAVVKAADGLVYKGEAQELFTEASSENGTEPAEMTVSIAQAENIWSVEPAAVSDLIYGKNERKLVSGGKASGGTVLYKLGENGSYSEEIPTAADAGTYTVYCKAEGNQNYSDIAEQSFTVQIAPKEIEFIWGDTELIYNGKEQAPAVTLKGVIDGDECEAEISGAKTEPGTYIAKINGLSNQNYVLADGEQMTAFSVAKEEYVVIIDANGGSGKRIKQMIGGDYILPDYKDYNFAAPENMKFVGWDVEGKLHNAGDTVTISDVTMIQAVWEDAKQKQDKLEFDDNKVEKTFGDETFVNELLGAMSNVTYESSNPDVAQVDKDGNVTVVGAGNAVITAHAEENDEYFGAEASYRVVVRKAAIKPTVSLENWTEGETPGIPEISGNDGNADVTFTYKSADSEEFTPDVPAESGNYTVKATIAESDNYLSGSAEAQFTIEEAPAEIHAELIASNTIGFKENIMLNFYADIDSDYADGAYVVFTYSHYGETKTVKAELNRSNTLTSGNITYFAFGCPLSVSETTVDVQAELYLADSTEAVSVQNGSVLAYCERMLGRDTTDDVTKNALKALLNFGGYTQQALNLNTDALANANYKSDLSNVTVEPSGEFVIPEQKVGGVKYMGAQLAMRDYVNCRYVFSVDSLDGVTFMVNGKEVTPVKDGKNYYIDAEHVKAINLPKVNEIVVKTAEAERFNQRAGFAIQALHSRHIHFLHLPKSGDWSYLQLQYHFFHTIYLFQDCKL